MKHFIVIILLLTLYLPGLTQLFAKPIIARHDASDAKLLQLAKNLPESNALFMINKTDLAGTLIAPEWILSAAHVATNLNIGDSLINRGSKFKIAQIVIHPEWQENESRDIALIKLAEAVKNCLPVSIYEERDELAKEVFLVGNGDIGTGKSGPVKNDGKIRAATNTVDEVSENWLKWSFNNPETDSSQVSRYEGISGPGDSSGPAFILIGDQAFIAGISSAQSTRATGGKEGVYGVREYYTRVSSYFDWINMAIANEQ
ncbi:MAG: S1 family peptidase [Calditrichia bacterium]